MSGTSTTWVDGQAVNKANVRALVEPWPIPAQWNGVIPASVDVLRLKVPIALELTQDLPLTIATALVNPTANADFTIKKNSSSIGTIRFQSGSPLGILITFSSTVTFAAGDLLQITSPASPDATLADISITLVGKR